MEMFKPGLVSGLSLILLAGCGASSVDPMFSALGGESMSHAGLYSVVDEGSLYHQATPPPANPTDNRTVIRLLTPTITNRAANQYLKFQVSYEGPSGNPVDFPFDELLFDIASINATGAVPLKYTISVSNSIEYAGLIAPVWGQDLFGNLGTNYYHYATDERLDIAAGVRWFVFSVDLSNTMNRPYGSSGPLAAQEVIDVYVRFGHEAMAAQAPVTFLNW